LAREESSEQTGRRFQTCAQLLFKPSFCPKILIGVTKVLTGISKVLGGVLEILAGISKFVGLTQKFLGLTQQETGENLFVSKSGCWSVSNGGFCAIIKSGASSVFQAGALSKVKGACGREGCPTPAPADSGSAARKRRRLARNGAIMQMRLASPAAAAEPIRWANASNNPTSSTSAIAKKGVRYE
jgi:hypothetical protein